MSGVTIAAGQETNFLTWYAQRRTGRALSHPAKSHSTAALIVAAPMSLILMTGLEMGTNYYIKGERCEHCGRADEDKHIGKSSAGWVFSLRIYPEEGIESLTDWKKFWRGKGIYDEYGRDVSKTEMLRIITKRSNAKTHWEIPPLGYVSWENFHRTNGSIRGPHGLLRHKITRHCIGHGRGTWDFIIGEFR